MDDERDPSETTRLLESHPLVPPALPTSPKSPSAWHCIVATAAVQVLLTITMDVAFAPQTDILQTIVCRNYYSDYVYSNTDPTVDRCKAEPIQAEVAYINAWANAFETIPSILLVVPFGIIADRIGRKKVLLMAIFGLFMNDAWVRIVYWFSNVFPVRAVWLAAFWQIIGGGPATVISMTMVLVADACSPDQRTTAFSQIKSARLVVDLIFLPVGGALISVNPWIPMFMSSGFMIMAFCVAAFAIPETFTSAVIPVVAQSGEPEDARGCLSGGDDSDSAKMSLRHRLRGHLARFADVGPLLAKNARLIPILLSFFAFQVGDQGGRKLLLQYVAKRLDWTIGKASYLLTIGAGVNLVVLTLLVPAISILLTRRLRLHAIAKDKLLAQGSGVFLVLGAGTFFFGTSWALLALGQVLYSVGDVFVLPVRSIATSLVEQNHLATLYTAIEVVTYGGIFVGGPLLASAFRWGMRLGDFWMGLPFLLAAGFFLLALLAVVVGAARSGGKAPEDAGTAVDGGIGEDDVRSEE